MKSLYLDLFERSKGKEWGHTNYVFYIFALLNVTCESSTQIQNILLNFDQFRLFLMMNSFSFVPFKFKIMILVFLNSNLNPKFQFRSYLL